MSEEELFIIIYHLSHNLLHELCTLLHLRARATELNDVTFLCGVREVDDDLEIEKESC